MARTIDLVASLKMMESGREIGSPDAIVDAYSITQWKVSEVVTLAAGASDVQFPFPTGLTTAKVLLLAVDTDSYITYSKNGTSTYHRVDADGLALVVGEFTSLYFSNGSATESVSVEVTIGG